MKERIGEQRVFEVTRNRLDDHPSIVNLMWERDERPDAFARVVEGPDHRRLRDARA